MCGYFNAYSQKEPMQLFYDAGYTNLAQEHDPEGWSYSFDGMIGSLDHIVANESGSGRVTGATDWSINAPESVMTQYRSEEHASELQSRGHLVCRLLLEKKTDD